MIHDEITVGKFTFRKQDALEGRVPFGVKCDQYRDWPDLWPKVRRMLGNEDIFEVTGFGRHNGVGDLPPEVSILVRAGERVEDGMGVYRGKKRTQWPTSHHNMYEILGIGPFVRLDLGYIVGQTQRVYFFPRSTLKKMMARFNPEGLEGDL